MVLGNQIELFFFGCRGLGSVAWRLARLFLTRVARKSSSMGSTEVRSSKQWHAWETTIYICAQWPTQLRSKTSWTLRSSSSPRMDLQQMSRSHGGGAEEKSRDTQEI